MTKISFVLAGGGMKGAFQAGVIDTLLRYGIMPDHVLGISVGSLNASLITRFTRRHNLGEAMISEWWYKNVRKPSDLFEEYGLFLQVLPAILRRAFNGLYGTKGLRRIIEQHLNVDDLLRSPIALTVGAVDMVSGKMKWATPSDEHFHDYLQASTSIPIIFPSIAIEGHSYVDGGVKTVAPLSPAIKQGAEEIYVILCHPSEQAAEYKPGNILIDTSRVIDLVTGAMIEKDVEFAEYVNKNLDYPGSLASKAGKRKIAIHIIRPEEELVGELDSFTPSDIQHMIKVGYRTAERYLAALHLAP